MVVCSLAHRFAYERARILHRDISAGNVLLTTNQEGLLIDWDLSVDVDILNSSPRRPERTVSLLVYGLNELLSAGCRAPGNSYLRIFFLT